MNLVNLGDESVGYNNRYIEYLTLLDLDHISINLSSFSFTYFTFDKDFMFYFSILLFEQIVDIFLIL